MDLATLYAVACLFGAAPDEEGACDPPFPVPLHLTMAACEDHGDALAERYMRGNPYFEFMELRTTICAPFPFTAAE